MTEVTTENLGALVKLQQGNTSLVPVSSSGQLSPLVSPLTQERTAAFYKIQELELAWQWLYERYIHPAIRNPGAAEVALEPLSNVIDAFDLAVKNVKEAGSLNKRVTEDLEALAEAVQPPQRRWFHRQSGERKRQRRRRGRIRDRVYSVQQRLEKMKRKVSQNPAWLRRFYDNALGQVDPLFQMFPAQMERAHHLAIISMKEPFHQLGDKILPEDVAKAYRMLGLEPYRNQSEMHERYLELIKKYHSDVQGGDPKRAAELNAARDRLDKFYTSLQPLRRD